MSSRRLRRLRRQPAQTQAPKPRAAASQRTVLPPEISQRSSPREGKERASSISRSFSESAQIRYVDTKTKVDYVEDIVLAAPVRDDSMPVEWDECFELKVDVNDLETEPWPEPNSRLFRPTLRSPRCYTAWNKDLVNWIYANRKIELHCSPASKEYSQPNESEGEFRARLQHTPARTTRRGHRQNAPEVRVQGHDPAGAASTR